MILFTLPCGRVVVNIRNRETPPKNQKLIFMKGHIVMFPVSLRSMNTTGTFSRARIMLPQTRKNRQQDGKFTGSATAVHKKAFINLKILS